MAQPSLTGMLKKPVENRLLTHAAQKRGRVLATTYRPDYRTRQSQVPYILLPI
jgi:hypothetical protein